MEDLTRTDDGAPLKVSVIIPVYNPGPAIDDCIASLLGQTMPVHELEVLFVDDGSTDGTGARLGGLAAEHPQVRLITIPNSGWPGKPRNVGLDVARGEYVMFVDQDDVLEPESLARQHRLGSRHGADVVLGKVISDFRGVNHDLYRRDRPACTVFDAPLMNSLTPHKMLRTAFLRDEGIRYPEGPRRLEDQLFMTRAYFAAASATVVGSYVCYRYQRRADGGNAGSKRIHPAGYYGNLREVLDVVDAHTEPGPVRDGFYRRFLRTEMLGRFAGAKLRAPRPEYYADLLAEVRRLAEERFPLSVDAGLGALLRVRAALVRSATLSEIQAHAQAVDRVRLDAKLVTARSTARAGLRLAVEAWLVQDGSPLALEPAPGGLWRLPASLGGGLSADLRVVEPMTEVVGDLVITHRERQDEWFLAGSLRPEIRDVNGVGRLIWAGTARLEPRKAAGGRPLRPGVHDVTVRVGVLGLSRTKRLAAAEDGAPPTLVDARGHVDQPYTTDAGNFSLQVGLPRAAVRDVLRQADVQVRVDGLRVVPGVRWAVPPTRATLVLVPEEGGDAVTWPAAVTASGTAVRARPALRGARPAAGAYRLRLSLEHASPKGSRTEAVDLETRLVVDAATARRWWLSSARASAARLVRRGRRRLARLLGGPAAAR